MFNHSARNGGRIACGWVMWIDFERKYHYGHAAETVLRSVGGVVRIP